MAYINTSGNAYLNKGITALKNSISSLNIPAKNRIKSVFPEGVETNESYSMNLSKYNNIFPIIIIVNCKRIFLMNIAVY